MKAIVVGSGGLAGSGLMEVLPELGYQCIGVTRQNYYRYVNEKADILINANGGTSKVRAAKDFPGEIQRTVETAARFAQDFRAQHYVLISSGDVYPETHDPALTREDNVLDPAAMSPYGLAKFQAEQVVRNRAASWLIVRSGGLIGPGLKKSPVYDALAGDRIYVHPESRFGYLHTHELARIIHTLVEASRFNEIFNVGGDGLVAVADILNWTGKGEMPCDESTVPIHYELNFDKIKSIYPLPDSASTVRAFIEHWPGS